MDDKERKIRIDVHEKTIDISKERIADLQAQLEAEKPELRHLDYGLTKSGRPCAIVQSQDGRGTEGQFRRCSGRYMYECELISDVWSIETKLGNLVDDLAAMSEDLEEFKVESGCFDFKAVLNKKNGRINMITQGAWMNIETAHEIILKLRRMEATAIRKAEGKE